MRARIRLFSSLSLEDLVGLGLEVGGDLASIRVRLARLLVDLVEPELLLLANFQQVHLDRVVTETNHKC